MRRLVSVLVSLAAVFASAGVLLSEPAVAATPVAAPGAGLVQGTVETRSIYYSAYSIYDLSFTGTLDAGPSSSYAGPFSLVGSSDWRDLPHGPCTWGTPWCQLGIRPPSSTTTPVTGNFTLGGSNDQGDSISGTCGQPGPARVGVAGSTFICTVALNGGPPRQTTITALLQSLLLGNSVAGTYTTAPTAA